MSTIGRTLTNLRKVGVKVSSLVARNTTANANNYRRITSGRCWYVQIALTTVDLEALD